MAARMLRALVVLHLVSVLIPSDCHRKKEAKKGLPTYRLHTNTSLPADVQVTIFLTKNESRRFYYVSIVGGGALSVTLVTCTSPVRWSFEPDNSTNVRTTEVMETYHSPNVLKGVYTLELIALERDTYVHVYVSTEKGGPQTLQQTAKNVNLRLVKRQKKKRLTVKWNPSLVDPRYTDYCLVVSFRKFHGTLCSVPRESRKEPMTACVGQKTHYTLANLTQGQKYYYNVFATNKRTNFTYPYGATSAVFDGKFRPVSLKDGKVAFGDLKKLDGKAVFRYKTGKNVSRPLEFFVLPCGGAVSVTITLNDVVVVGPIRVHGFRRLSVKEPQKSAKYHIKTYTLNREEMRKMTGVEVYATTRSLAKIPFVEMPEEVNLKEYTSVRTCDSVTVGWMSAPVQKKVRYCLTAKEVNSEEMDDYSRIPNQCGLDRRLRKSTDFTVKFCMDMKGNKEKVIVRKVNQLQPGRGYVIQVTVKKLNKGKTLSYNFLYAETKSCKTERPLSFDID